MGGAKALCGAIYNVRPTIDTAMTNMSPVFTVPETPRDAIPPTSPVFQAIPGQTYTPPTPTNPTVNPPIPTALPGVAATDTSKPWYQWFIDHPLYTALIVIGGGGLIYWATKNKK